MDATQAYSKVKSVAQRMHGFYGELGPKVAFVFMLRDPVARLHSNYFHRLKCCLGDTTFEQWVEIQIREVQVCLETNSSASLWPYCGEEGLFAGFYGLQLQHWTKYFCPSQFMLVSFNGFVRDPAFTMARIFARVGIVKSKGRPTAAIASVPTQ